MASPQTEEGFTKIANELLGAIICYHCSGGQKDIILAVIRATYGFHRTEHPLSITYIARMTKRNKNKVAKDVKHLISKKILTEISAPTYSDSRVISMNKNYEEWEGYERLTASESDGSTVSDNADSTVSDTADSTVSASAYQYKDNIKEKKERPYKDIFIPEEKKHPIEGRRDAEPSPSQSSKSPIWYQNIFFIVTHEDKDTLQKQYRMVDQSLKKEFDKMQTWLTKKDIKLGNDKIFISNWLSKCIPSASNNIQQKELPTLNSQTPSWMNG